MNSELIFAVWNLKKPKTTLCVHKRKSISRHTEVEKHCGFNGVLTHAAQ